MVKASGNRTGARGPSVVQAVSAAKKAAQRLRTKEQADSVAADVLADDAPQAGQGVDEDNETQQMDEDDARPGAGASSATPKALHGSQGATPPTKDKQTVARSLSSAMTAGTNGANNVGKLAHDRATAAEYESQIEELQRKLQTLEGKVSSPAPSQQKRGGARSERSPAKEPPFKKGGVDVAADPWKKIFQLAGECLWHLNLTGCDLS
jgi:hypothetical protein